MALKEPIYEYNKTQAPKQNWGNGKTNTNNTLNNIPARAKNTKPKRHLMGKQTSSMDQ